MINERFIYIPENEIPEPREKWAFRGFIKGLNRYKWEFIGDEEE